MRSAGAVVTIVLSGCSFVSVRPNPRPVKDDAEPVEQVYCQRYGVVGADLSATLTSVPAFLIGAMACYESTSGCEEKGRNYNLLGAGLAALFGASAIYGLVATQVCMDRLVPGRIMFSPPVAPMDERASTLTRQAKGAARSGDCARAVALGREVQKLDAEIYAAVFIDDSALKACLDAAASNQSPHH